MTFFMRKKKKAFKNFGGMKKETTLGDQIGGESLPDWMADIQGNTRKEWREYRR